MLLFASLTYSATNDNKQRFLKLYYSGKYPEAHAIVTQANSDPVSTKAWEERLHIHEVFSDCDFQSDTSMRAIALLRIGFVDQAKNHFGNDWLSLLGRAQLAGWNNDFAAGREYVRKAMTLNPDHPDMFFYAARYAVNDDEALNYFRKYLQTFPSDVLKKNSARQTIEFILKTKGLRLNDSQLASPVETITSKFDNRRLTFRAKIDQTNDVELLLDTGASGLSLKDKNWKARNATDFMMIGLGAKQRTRAALVVFDQFSSGKFMIKNPVAAVSPNLQASGIDGIAGTILFSGYNIVVPLKKGSPGLMISALDSEKLLARMEQEGFVYKQKMTIPFHQVGKMIILKGRIKRSDDEMDILLDTGAQTSIVSAAAARKHVYINYPKTLRKKSRIRLVGIGGKIDNLLHVENVDIEVGPLRKSFNRMVAANLSQISEALELEVDLILGQDFLYGYTLLIDYKKNLVTFLS